MKKRILFWSSLLLSFVVAGIIFWKGGQQEGPALTPDFKAIKADLVLYGVKFQRETKAGKGDWFMTGALARFFEKKQVVQFERVKIEFQTSDGGEPVRVKGEQGSYNLAKAFVSVSGNVVVKGLSGYTLFTDILFYFPKKNIITAPRDVKIISKEGDEILGNSMKYLLKKHIFYLTAPKVKLKDQEV